MEVQYENRIVQLSLRLKKEELALHSLKSKESQLQSLTAQYTALLHDNMQQQ